MFNRIKHTGSSEGMTTACYADGEVIGEISFFASHQRTCILSSIGPDELIRECALVHRYSGPAKRHKAHARDEINSYAPQLRNTKNS